MLAMPKLSLGKCQCLIWHHQTIHNTCLLTTTIIDNNPAQPYHQPNEHNLTMWHVKNPHKRHNQHPQKTQQTTINNNMTAHKNNASQGQPQDTGDNNNKNHPLPKNDHPTWHHYPLPTCGNNHSQPPNTCPPPTLTTSNDDDHPWHPRITTKDHHCPQVTKTTPMSTLHHHP